VSLDDYNQALDIMQQTIKAVRAETGFKYVGFLYGQFMATADGVKVIEFNVRLGDPEAMNTLPLLDGDFVDVCQRMVGGMLSANPAFNKQATVCKYLVPSGYPTEPAKDLPVAVDADRIREVGGRVYYASVREQDGKVLTGTSRALAVLGGANTISEAEVIAEESVACIEGDLFHRKDIGTYEVVQKRVKHMRVLRNLE